MSDGVDGSVGVAACCGDAGAAAVGREDLPERREVAVQLED